MSVGRNSPLRTAVCGHAKDVRLPPIVIAAYRIYRSFLIIRRAKGVVASHRFSPTCPQSGLRAGLRECFWHLG